MDEDRLRKTKGMNPLSSEKGVLHGWVLSFTKDEPVGQNWGRGVLGLPDEGFEVRVGEGHTLIEPKKGGIVEGTLYRITEEDSKILDKWEGKPGIDDVRQPVEVVRENGNPVQAYAYRSLNKKEGLKPSREYLFMLILLATKIGLSEKYINYLANIETL
jgi:cation transport regulator ChaC